MNPAPAGEIGKEEKDHTALESIIGTGMQETGMVETGIETMAEALAATANMKGDLPTVAYCRCSAC